MNQLSDLLDSNASGSSSVVTTVTIPSREIDILAVKEKIATMNAALLAVSPMMPVLLREIHNLIRKDPELITIISEEEIGMIVNGLKVQTNTVLTTTVVKSSTSAATKQKMLKLTVDDI